MSVKQDTSSAHGPDPGSSAPTVSRRELVVILSGLLIAVLLAALDQLVLSTALPAIVGDLGGVDQMLWVTTSYLIAMTIVMPVYGKVGDVIGHKVPLLTGLLIFLAGSVLGGLANGMGMLVAARAVQGLGAGGLMILAQAVIADLAPPRQRSKYMGIVGTVWPVASVVGPLLGGWFADGIGWRWAFWYNLPLGLIAIAAAAIFLKMPLKKPERFKIDVAGISTMAIAVTAVVMVTSWAGREYAWGSPIILGLIGLAVVAAIVFVLMEKRAVEPVMPLHLFRDRNFNLATLGALLVSVPMFGLIAYMPSYLQMSADLSATNSGLLLVTLEAGITGAALTTGFLAARTGRYKWMPIASCFIMALGLFLLSRLVVGSALVAIGAYLFIFGAGIGLSVQIFVLIVQNSFPLAQVGTATAANNFFREIGAALGSAVVGTLFTHRLMSLLGERLPAATGGSSVVVDAKSLTPALVDRLPAGAQEAVVTSYSDALTPVFLYLVPMMIIAGIMLFFIQEKPLAVSNVAPEEARMGG
ncbi:MAG: MDR family MFS transporter [Thermoleophilia bacterium]|jgi:EmrB/QacA subfamily drug resistance transporter